MRVSTTMMFQTGTNQMTKLQSELLKTTQQVSLNQNVLVPSDDPVASARALNLSQTQDLNKQYGTARNNARSNLDSVEAKLSSVTDMMIDVRSKVIAAANGSYTDKERANMASELQEQLDQLVGYANETDSQGDYLFSGYKSTTRPFVKDDNGNIVYKGDQGERSLIIDSGRQMGVSLAGSSIFQGNGEDMFKTMQQLVTALANPTSEAANKADSENAEKLPEYIAYKTAKDLLDNTDPTDPNYSNYELDANQKKLLADKAEENRVPVSGSLKDLYSKLGVAGTSIDKLIDNLGKYTSDVGGRQKELDTLDNIGTLKDTNYTSEGNYLLGRNASDIASAISKLSLQQTYLSAAQKVFVSTSKLSLLNYMS